MSINTSIGYTTWRHSQLHFDGLYAVLLTTKYSFGQLLFFKHMRGIFYGHVNAIKSVLLFTGFDTLWNTFATQIAYIELHGICKNIQIRPTILICIDDHIGVH